MTKLKETQNGVLFRKKKRKKNGVEKSLKKKERKK